MATSNETIVSEFCEAWRRKDAEELLGYFTDDAVYHNIPMVAVVGKDAIREAFGFFLPLAESVEWEMVNLASAGDVVFTERVDRFEMGGKTVALPVAGVFELRGGKIAAWRDYFDLADWQRQTGM